MSEYSIKLTFCNIRASIRIITLLKRTSGTLQAAAIKICWDPHETRRSEKRTPMIGVAILLHARLISKKIEPVPEQPSRLLKITDPTPKVKEDADIL